MPIKRGPCCDDSENKRFHGAFSDCCVSLFVAVKERTLDHHAWMEVCVCVNTQSSL